MYGCPELFPKNSKSSSSCWLPMEDSCTNIYENETLAYFLPYVKSHFHVFTNRIRLS